MMTPGIFLIIWYLSGVFFALSMMIWMENDYKKIYEKYKEPYHKSFTIGHLFASLFLGIGGPIILIILFIMMIVAWFDSEKGKKIMKNIGNFMDYKIWEENEK